MANSKPPKKTVKTPKSAKASKPTAKPASKPAVENTSDSPTSAKASSIKASAVKAAETKKPDPVKLSKFGEPKPDVKASDTQSKSGKGAATTPKASAPAPKHKKTLKPKGPKTGVSFASAAAMAIIAALIGGGIGWMGPKIFDPANAAPAEAISKNSEAITALSSKSAALEQTSTQIQSSVNRLNSATAPVAGLKDSVSALQANISQLQSRDIAGERAAALSPLQMQLDAIETLIAPDGEPDAEGVDAANGRVSVLLERLTALETQIETLKSQPPIAMQPSVLSYSVGANNGASSPAEDPAKDEAKDAPYDFVANFPKQAMLSALAVQDSNREDPSWLRKILNKHVQTDDVSAAQTRLVIQQAEALTRKGDIAGAVKQIETLNPTLRAAAHQWLIEAKKSR